MSRKFWIGSTITLSALWAVGVWAGYQLLLLTAGLMEQSQAWWAAYPGIQAVLLWLGNVAQGMQGILLTLVLAGWAIGQGCLLIMLWLGLRFGTREQLHSVRHGLQQRIHTWAAPPDDVRCPGRGDIRY